MYNLNVNLAQTAADAVSNLLVDSTCTTPRTPEILNSLIAMTNPLDGYNFGSCASKVSNGPPTNMSSDSNSSSSSQVESPTNHTPSVQHTCSQLIKAGLKLSIEQKRKHQNDGEDLLDLDKCKRIKHHESESEEDKHKQDPGMNNWAYYETDDYSKLTPEDEERRRRRRERNKIAATKCRLKKRERTANLISESEILETQNVDLKGQLQELQTQKRNLMDMLTVHRPHCQHNIGPATREKLCRKLPSINSVLDQHSYSRPASVDNNFRTTATTLQNLDIYTRPASVGLTYNTRPNNNLSYTKPPSIIVEDTDYQPEFTDLDEHLAYYSNQCHNNNYNVSQNYSGSSGIDNGCMA